ncbi:MAG: MBL fold metallo-hydrolase [Nitrospirae bacterium]|nr:MBL fold metallo-hydrolase [Nitrospirota bacterium]
MLAFSLQSGSNGNCIYVETGGVKLLIDAGINGVQAEKKLAAQGRDIRDVDAVIISHDHGDHIRYAGIYQRKYGLPLYVTQKTLDISVKRHPLGKLHDVRLFQSDGVINFEQVTVHAIPTPHDTADGAAFVITSGNKRLGIMTDLGHAFDGLEDVIATLDAVFIESNYDPDMLARGPYTAFLQKRIRGPEGHLSNLEAAELLRAASQRNLKWACLAHLSEQNNKASLAIATHRKVVHPRLPLYIASRYTTSDILSI